MSVNNNSDRQSNQYKKIIETVKTIMNIRLEQWLSKIITLI